MFPSSIRAPCTGHLRALTRRQALGAAAATPALGLLAGCGGREAGGGAAPQPGALHAEVTIQLMFNLGAAVTYLWEPVVQRWQAAHPQGPKLDVQIGTAGPEKLQTLLAVDQALFDRAGVPYPPVKVDATGWDFNAFLSAADRLTRRNGNDIQQYGCLVARNTHRKASFKWDLGVNPQGKGKPTGGGVDWEIIAKTKYPEEAWAVLQHVIGPESSKAMATTWYPARKSTLLIALDPDLPPKNRQVGADGQTIMAPDPIFPAYDDVEKIITSELSALWNNEKPARQVVDSLVPKVNAALKAK